MMKSKPDFTISNHGNVWGFQPLTPAAHTLCEGAIHIESWQWMGGAFMVDHRMAAALVATLRENEGMIVEGEE